MYFVVLHWHHGLLYHCDALLFLFANSEMNNIINKKTNWIHVETFAAIQTIKYKLRAMKQSSVTRYKRINFLRSPIIRKLCQPMQLFYKAQSDKLEALKQNKKRKKLEFGRWTYS